jgi:dipeptidyl aminopeptidase/acylaminoacyl peptidase
MKINSLRFLVLAVFCAISAANDEGPKLELIMSNTDWIGNAPENAYWSDDGLSIYYQKKRDGNDVRDWYQLDTISNALSKLDAKAVFERDHNGGAYNQDRTFKLFTLQGDVYQQNMKTGERQRITYTSAKEADPQFITATNEIVYWQGNKAIKISPQGQLIELLTIENQKKSAKSEEDYDFLTAQQQRYFITLREKKASAEMSKQQRDEINKLSNPVEPFYLDKNLVIEEKLLSPDAKFALLIVSEKSFKRGKNDQMPRFVDDSGYVAIQKVRPLVGENMPTPQYLVIMDLVNHKQQQIKLDSLPGMDKDPLRKLRKKSSKWHQQHGASKQEADQLVAAPDTREVNIWGAEWSKDSQNVAVLIKTIDNKDRWISTINTKNLEISSQHRLHDNAWINWRFNQFGWLPDNKTLWLLSEQDGFSHVYLKSLQSKRAKQVTSGHWEVHDPVLTRDGKTLYFRSNQTHPGIYEINKLDLNSGEITQVSNLGGSNTFIISEDEKRLLIQHSSITSKPDIFVKELSSSKKAVRLTETMSEQFKKIDWVIPSIEKVKSSHVKQPIYSKLYQPKTLQKDKKYPAVIFVHGAGYTQNSHFGWAYYFHELMFHTLLVNQGYIVLDMDYRGSAGYGRDWRTAIYRNMGHPEVEDLQDGVDFLVENYQVDKTKVGVYGGSYGGFLTFMAMFREPELFAAGAALRPVTDWAHYNHQYTSNILNTPAVDPMAYERSSPIEFADGLAKPILIAHGMLDDNVFFKDSVRLVQKLIELKKQNFEMAIYPMERHSFTHHTSWLNEYRKIYKLFEENLK